MNIQEQFVPYEIALKLKELGFDEECFGYYYDKTDNIQTSYSFHFNGKGERLANDVNAPLFQQVIQWLREKYNIHIIVKSYNDEELNQILYENDIIDVNDNWNEFSDYTFYHTYQEALTQAIIESLKLIKNEITSSKCNNL